MMVAAAAVVMAWRVGLVQSNIQQPCKLAGRVSASNGCSEIQQQCWLIGSASASNFKHSIIVLMMLLLAAACCQRVLP